MANLKEIYLAFLAALDNTEQLDSTPVYLGLLEVMRQDIEQRQRVCVEIHMRPNLINKSQIDL
jgi:hypothetical protein